MSTTITPADRRRLAVQLGINEQYLYQCLAGIRDMKPGTARRLEEQSGGELMRWSLCQTTWREIWPELADRPDAPPEASPAGEGAEAAGEVRNAAAL